MAERDVNPLEQAGGLFRRILERVGATVDEKLAAGDSSRLPATAVGALAAALERSIESNLRADARGVRRVAPDRYAILLTYEQNGDLNDAHRQALAKELAASAYEYIANHRYTTLKPVFVEVGCDLFVGTTTIRTSFSPAPGETADGAVSEVRPTAAGNVKPIEGGADYRLVGSGGKPVYTVRIAPGGDPITFGRSAGNRILIDHHSVSKFHATIGMGHDGQLLVTDLDTTNGTFVNGDRTRVTGIRPISAGDTILFGDVPFRIEKVG
jgi:hypothetical protein